MAHVEDVVMNVKIEDWEFWRYKFAGMAMQAGASDTTSQLSAEETAECAVKYADALLAELKKGKT
jgi:hypothetical protein